MVKKTVKAKTPVKASPAKRPATRADLGAPIDGWFAGQPQPQRAIAEALRELVRDAAPDATGSIPTAVSKGTPRAAGTSSCGPSRSCRGRR